MRHVGSFFWDEKMTCPADCSETSRIGTKLNLSCSNMVLSHCSASLMLVTICRRDLSTKDAIGSHLDVLR
jgi:hypothetical protein